MLVKDAHIIRIIEQIGEHYRANLSSRFVRPALHTLALDKQTWESMEDLTEKIEHYRYQGFLLEELYVQIRAASHFVSAARRDLVPTLRNRLSYSEAASPNDRVLRDMAINNFGSNLQVFADMIYDLFKNLINLDESNTRQRRTPLYTSIPGFQDLENILKGP